jgi:hypothetical protein
MARLSLMEEWLAATARDESKPAVRFSSCFPFMEDIGFVVPPRSVWPPPGAGLAPSKVRWKSARFIPLGLVRALLSGQVLDEEHWVVDGASECLLPAGRAAPFRTAVRWSAAVDRLSGCTERHSTACLEFRPGGGMWAVVAFADEPERERWAEPVRAAFRLLADSGFGGERSRGWGRSEQPEFMEGMLPEMILPRLEPPAAAPAPPAEPGEAAGAAPADDAPQPAAGPPQAVQPGARAHWLLSLFTPSAGDAVDWSRGNYTLVTRGGRVESPARSGELKKQMHMVAEGSVLVAADTPRGAAADVAPDGFPHPVYRAGFALSVPIPSPQAPV